jgi:hypothetical protein
LRLEVHPQKIVAVKPWSGGARSSVVARFSDAETEMIMVAKKKLSRRCKVSISPFVSHRVLDMIRVRRYSKNVSKRVGEMTSALLAATAAAAGAGARGGGGLVLSDGAPAPARARGAAK